MMDFPEHAYRLGATEQLLRSLEERLNALAKYPPGSLKRCKERFAELATDIADHRAWLDTSVKDQCRKWNERQPKANV